MKTKAISLLITLSAALITALCPAAAAMAGGNGSTLQPAKTKFEIKRGVNIAHWVSQTGARGEERARIFTERDVEQLAAWGFDHIRIPVGEEQLFSPDGTMDNETMTLIETAIGWCKKHNMHAIFDLHNLRSHHFNEKNNTLWTSTEAQQRLCDMWEKIARRLDKFPVTLLAYELLNEPVADKNEEWNKVLAKLLPVVRDINKKRVILVPSNKWDSVDNIPDVAIPDNDKNFYLVSSVMEEAIASSQMEGASTTRKVAKEMLRKKLKPRDKSQLMIANNYATIRYLSEHRQDEFSVERLLEIHRYISSGTLDDKDDEGNIRRTDDIVVMDGITGDIAHTPPPHEEVKQLLEDLCSFANNDSPDNFIHPIIKGIILHFMLAYIHPFADGNGRTARSLVYWYMMKKGYWLTEYLSISRIIYTSKAKYEHAFLYTERDDNDLSYFIQFNLDTMKRAYEELKNYLQRKISERDSILMFKDMKGINQRQAHILKVIAEKGNEILTTKEVATRFNITSPTARADLQNLVRLGFMTEIPLNNKMSGYVRADSFKEKMEQSTKVK